MDLWSLADPCLRGNEELPLSYMRDGSNVGFCAQPQKKRCFCGDDPKKFRAAYLITFTNAPPMLLPSLNTCTLLYSLFFSSHVFIYCGHVT